MAREAKDNVIITHQEASLQSRTVQDTREGFHPHYFLTGEVLTHEPKKKVQIYLIK
jgi:hypothetical protein